MNNSLVDSLLTGAPMEEVEPLDLYMQHQWRRLPTDNPKTLLTYSASSDTNTDLPRNHFLSFGIPRAKKQPPALKRENPASETRTAAVPSDIAEDMAELDLDDGSNENEPRSVGAESARVLRRSKSSHRDVKGSSSKELERRLMRTRSIEQGDNIPDRDSDSNYNNVSEKVSSHGATSRTNTKTHKSKGRSSSLHDTSVGTRGQERRVSSGKRHGLPRMSST